MQQTGTSDKALVATKFAPLPWRFTSQSVIDACKVSNNTCSHATLASLCLPGQLAVVPLSDDASNSACSCALALLDVEWEVHRRRRNGVWLQFAECLYSFKLLQAAASSTAPYRCAICLKFGLACGIAFVLLLHHDFFKAAVTLVHQHGMRLSGGYTWVNSASKHRQYEMQSRHAHLDFPCMQV